MRRESNEGCIICCGNSRLGVRWKTLSFLKINLKSNYFFIVLCSFVNLYVRFRLIKLPPNTFTVGADGVSCCIGRFNLPFSGLPSGMTTTGA